MSSDGLRKTGRLQQLAAPRSSVESGPDTRLEAQRKIIDLAQLTDEMESLYETAPIGLCVVNTELVYLRINDFLAAINGRSVSEHIGRRVRDVAPQLNDLIEAPARRVLESGEPVLDLEIRGTTPAAPDEERIFRMSFLPIESDRGSVSGVSIVVLDVPNSTETQ